jgi:uncharacterized membrane protein YtjA (UPF0391 family)
VSAGTAREPTSRDPVSQVVSATIKDARNIMGNLLYWAVIFLIVALVAAFLGFGGVAGVATEGARILFWVAIVLVVLSFIGGMLRRG